jgi:hypothetical protein
MALALSLGEVRQGSSPARGLHDRGPDFGEEKRDKCGAPGARSTGAGHDRVVGDKMMAMIWNNPILNPKLTENPRWPSIESISRELLSINEVIESEEIDEDIDVRLQVLPNGDWKIWWGDPQYDTDHRGYWGAGSIPGGGRRFNATETARDLIEQAKEDFAMSH